MHPRDLHEQEEDIFDNDEDDTITVSCQDCKIVCYDSKKFVLQKISDVKFSDITSVRK